MSDLDDMFHDWGNARYFVQNEEPISQAQSQLNELGFHIFELYCDSRCDGKQWRCRVQGSPGTVYGYGNYPLEAVHQAIARVKEMISNMNLYMSSPKMEDQNEFL